MRPPRVAIVHERFTELGGSERVVEQLHSLWPHATVHTTILDRTVLPPGLVDANMRASPLQKLYRGGRDYGHLLPFFPAAVARIDVGDVDLVIASHHAFANRVRLPRGCRFVSYTHTPARWLWDPSLRALEGGIVARTVLDAFARTQRGPDRAAARRPDMIVVNSAHVAERVRSWWGRAAEVVHPPVDTERFSPDASIRRDDFFLLAGRLVPYKRPEVAALAARRAGVRLVIAGEGRSRSAVEQASGEGVEILGEVDDDMLVDLYRRCAALVMPGVEDFGLVPLEAQACGTPVIALRAGGAIESVVDGVTGVLYTPRAADEVEVLAQALATFDPARFDTAVIRSHAERFSVERFRVAISELLERLSPWRGR
jgi:glycosyltransferase involved in cell wall biosynthesis